MKAETQFKFEGRRVVILGYSTSDWIYTSIENTKTFYEADLLKYIRFALRNRDGCILDVGANIGNHSVFFGMFMKNKIVSFEPNPSVFKILETNLLANNIEFKAYNIGLGADDGRFAIDDEHEGAKNNIGAARLDENVNGEAIVRRLDDLAEKINFKDEGILAIKVDIEGMEPEMLRGGASTLKKYKPDLFIEISNEQMMHEITGILLPLGYKRLYAHAATPVWHFSHDSNLSWFRRVELSVFRIFVKTVSFPQRLYSAISRRLSSI